MKSCGQLSVRFFGEGGLDEAAYSIAGPENNAAKEKPSKQTRPDPKRARPPEPIQNQYSKRGKGLPESRQKGQAKASRRHKGADQDPPPEAR